MAFSKIIQREFEVAFSKKTQPIWLRILKYVLLGGMIYLLRESEWLWTILSLLMVLALTVHFWYRYKTNGWTKSYGGWKHEQRA